METQNYNSKVNIINFVAVLFAFTFLLLPSSVYAAGATLSLSPTSGTHNKGCAFQVNILLDTGGTQTDGTDAIVFYDPTRITATKITNGSIYPDYPGNNIDAQQGRITVSGLSSISSAFTGSGTLATIDFSVTANAPAGTTQVKFDFEPSDKSKTTDSNVVERTTVADVLNQVNDATFTIGSGAGCGVAAQGNTQLTGVDQGAVTQTKTPVTQQKELPQSADFQTTWAVAAAGGILLMLGLVGLAFF